MTDYEQRTALAQDLILLGSDPIDLELEPMLAGFPVTATLTADLSIPFPESLAPRPEPIDPAPDPDAPLPHADVVVITWTVAELNALADVLTPGHGRVGWYRYRKGFAEHYLPMIRQGAPALATQRLGSYFLTTIGHCRVLCFKSELHLNQDGIVTGDGTATLPVRDLFGQIIEEVRPRVVLTVGTSGGVAGDQSLGDVVVTRGARFRCRARFKNEPWNNTTFTSDWQIPTQWFEQAEQLMRGYADDLVEPAFGPPTKRYGAGESLLSSEPPNIPRIHLDGRDLPAFHPILTTDFYEFGTSSNGLAAEGAAVEMGDATLGLVCSQLPDPPRWVVVRNISDPQINGDLPTEPKALNMQTHWAVWYYATYGYWTSVTGALAAWAIIAGLSDELAADPGQ
jgi:nucleoside phosphorylase